MSLESLTRLPHGLVKPRQRYHGRTELTEALRFYQTLAVPESIEQPHQSRSLSGEVVQVQQLESALLRCLHRTFYLLLVENRRQPPRCFQIVISLMEQTFLCQVVANGLKVQRIQHTCVFINLLHVGIDTILAYLMRHQRHGDVSCSLAIITLEVGHPFVEYTLSSHPSVGSPLRDKELILWLLVLAMPLLKGKGRSSIEMSWVLLLHIPCQPVQKAEVRLQFVAAAHDAERRMIPIMAQDVFSLPIEEMRRSRVRIHRHAPVRQLHLAVEAHPVSHPESRLRRTPGVEAQMVQPIVPSRRKHLHPAPFVHRRSASQWKDAALQRTTQKRRPSIDKQTIALCIEFPHAEGNSFLLSIGRCT